MSYQHIPLNWEHSDQSFYSKSIMLIGHSIKRVYVFMEEYKMAITSHSKVMMATVELVITQHVAAIITVVIV